MATWTIKDTLDRLAVLGVNTSSELEADFSTNISFLSDALIQAQNNLESKTYLGIKTAPQVVKKVHNKAPSKEEDKENTVNSSESGHKTKRLRTSSRTPLSPVVVTTKERCCSSARCDPVTHEAIVASHDQIGGISNSNVSNVSSKPKKLEVVEMDDSDDEVESVEQDQPTCSRWELNKKSTVGRDDTNDVCIPNSDVSSCHGKINKTKRGGFSLVDLGSTNGTKVNGKKCGLKPSIKLKQGDDILFGDTQVVVECLKLESQGDDCDLLVLALAGHDSTAQGAGADVASQPAAEAEPMQVNSGKEPLPSGSAQEETVEPANAVFSQKTTPEDSVGKPSSPSDFDIYEGDVRTHPPAPARGKPTSSPTPSLQERKRKFEQGEHTPPQKAGPSVVAEGGTPFKDSSKLREKFETQEPSNQIASTKMFDDIPSTPSSVKNLKSLFETQDSSTSPPKSREQVSGIASGLRAIVDKLSLGSLFSKRPSTNSTSSTPGQQRVGLGSLMSDKPTDGLPATPQPAESEEVKSVQMETPTDKMVTPIARNPDWSEPTLLTPTARVASLREAFEQAASLSGTKQTPGSRKRLRDTPSQLTSIPESGLDAKRAKSVSPDPELVVTDAVRQEMKFDAATIAVPTDTVVDVPMEVDNDDGLDGQQDGVDSSQQTSSPHDMAKPDLNILVSPLSVAEVGTNTQPSTKAVEEQPSSTTAQGSSEVKGDGSATRAAAPQAEPSYIGSVLNKYANVSNISSFIPLLNRSADKVEKAPKKEITVASVKMAQRAKEMEEKKQAERARKKKELIARRQEETRRREEEKANKASEATQKRALMQVQKEEGKKRLQDIEDRRKKQEEKRRDALRIREEEEQKKKEELKKRIEERERRAKEIAGKESKAIEEERAKREERKRRLEERLAQLKAQDGQRKNAAGVSDQTSTSQSGEPGAPAAQMPKQSSVPPKSEEAATTAHSTTSSTEVVDKPGLSKLSKPTSPVVAEKIVIQGGVGVSNVLEDDPNYLRQMEDSDSDSHSSADESSKVQQPWALRHNLEKALSSQHLKGDPDQIFPIVGPCNLEEIFAHTDTSATKQKKKKNYSKRGSSGNWAKDRLTWKEEYAYKKAMGYM